MSFFSGDKRKREGKPYLRKVGAKRGGRWEKGEKELHEACAPVDCALSFSVLLDNQDLVLSGIRLECCVG